MAGLNKDILGARGIEFFENINSDWTPGQQVELLYELLLAEFKGVLARGKAQTYQVKCTEVWK